MKTLKVRVLIFLVIVLALLFVPALAHAATYDVGQNQPYTTLSSVPWPSLQPGDTVNIHGQVQPYREQILLTASGTAGNPITVQGVPGPNGEPAVIDGENATQSPSIFAGAGQYAYTYTYGLVQIGRPNVYSGAYVPSYISIKNLTIQNGYQTNTFTAYNGKVTNYAAFCAGIYATAAQHLIVSGCTLTGNGLGLFINSTGSFISRDLLIEGNSIYGNGVVGSAGEHNTYTEAVGTVYQYNYFGGLRAGAGGCELKDRSAGTVVRYNWIGGGGHCIDLVETQGGEGVINLDPTYKTTYVYGNIIDNEGLQGATSMVHYGGDQWNYTYYRRGTLYFYNNTVVNVANRTGINSRYYTILFSLPQMGETNNLPVQEKVDCRNNIIYAGPQTPGVSGTDIELIDTDGTGTLNLGANWVSSKWLPFHPRTSTLATITGIENLIIGDPITNSPGFNEITSQDFTLTSASPCLGQAGPVNPAVLPDYPVTQEYEATASSQPRVTMPVVDLGAYEGASRPISLAPGQLPIVNVNDAWVIGVNTAGGFANFGIWLSAAPLLPVTITLTPVDGTAKAGVVYMATAATVTIPAGTTSGVASIPLLTLSATMPACAFTLDISNAVNATIGRANATCDVVPTGIAPIPPASAPTISPSGGSFTAAQTVVISDATSGATIYYTTDGTTPTVNSTLYSGPVNVLISETLKAIAIAPAFVASGTNSATFVVNIPPPILHSFVAGLTMMSSPVDDSGLSLSSAFNGTGVSLAVWDPASLAYDLSPTAPADTLHPGLGYWVRFKAVTELLGIGQTENSSDPISIPLAQGWNMIGCPWTSPVAVTSVLVVDSQSVANSFADAANVGQIGGVLYTYQPGDTAYEVVDAASGSLTPYEGYWLYASAACTLRIPSP